MALPNILYIHSHDTGRYIQPYGHAVPTPTLQKLAGQGVLFRQAFCAGPTCSPSRAALLTGQYPHQNGMYGLAHIGFSLNDYGKHLLHTLRKSGYRSALSGIQHIAHGPTAAQVIGYDEHLAPPAKAHEGAVRFLESAPRQPFFLSVGFFETHLPFPAAGPEDSPDHCLPPAPLPDTPQTRGDMAGFKASARSLDMKIAMVLDALDRAKLADNTLVICTTDHGLALPRMKCNLTDSGIGVMLLMRGPGGFAGGKVVDSLVSHVDVFPTICDLIGIAPPPWLEGVSLMPIIRGKQETVREEIHAEINYHVCYEPTRCVRTARYKYIKRFDDRKRPLLPNTDKSLSKQLWLDGGWNRRDPGHEALYDLLFDPNEMKDLCGDPDASAILRDMQGRLRRWMERTNDPLLKGPVPAPKGARMCYRDGVHVQDEPMWLVGEDGRGWEDPPRPA